MSNETRFVDGLIVKAPHERAPDYVKARLSIRREELAAWLRQQSGDWINVDIKESQQGKWYAAVDTWKPDNSNVTRSTAPRSGAPRTAPPSDDFDSDDIPF